MDDSVERFWIIIDSRPAHSYVGIPPVAYGPYRDEDEALADYRALKLRFGSDAADLVELRPVSAAKAWLSDGVQAVNGERPIRGARGGERERGREFGLRLHPN